MGNPVIGYSGMVNEARIDQDVIDHIATERPRWQLVFIGTARPDLTSKYSNLKNVHFLPPVDYKSLPDYLHYFDVAFVPFKINEHTRGNNLLKFHDYLAMGKPVVSTDIGGAADLQDVLMTAEGPSDFLAKIEMSLKGDARRQ